MFVKVSGEYREERSRLRKLDCAEEEVALKTWVHDKRTCSRIHRCDVHSALDFLNCELGTIIPVLVVFVLTNEGNSTLRIIEVESGHVKIINEVNELILADRPVDLASSTLELLL